MNENCTGLIIITDGFPCANSGGISQTLFNLLSNYQGSMLVMIEENEVVPEGPKINARQVVYSNGPTVKPYPYAVGRWLNARVQRFRFNWREKNWKCPALPKEFLVLVSTTVPEKLHIAWLLLQRGYSVLPYFMDDWMAGNKLEWKNNNVFAITGDILKQAPAWLMISKQLEQTLLIRYNLAKKPCLVIHNPSPFIDFKVDIGDQFTGEPKAELVENALATEKIRVQKVLPEGEPALPPGRDLGGAVIVYAGSIWPMHFDALLAVARAVTFLYQNNEKRYRLLIYTADAVWQHNRKWLEGPGVSYGGYQPYSAIHNKMAAADLLLVTASFDEQYLPYTLSSVQTKLTDYMAVGKPILYVGPSEGASGGFVHEWDCGYTIGTSNPEDIAAQLTAIAAMPKASERKAVNGLKAANDYFKKETVQQRLYAFFSRYSAVEEG